MLLTGLESLADFVIPREELKELYCRMQKLTAWNRDYHKEQTKKLDKESTTSRCQAMLDDDARVRT